MSYQYAKVEDCLDVVDILIDSNEKKELLRTSLFGNLLEASRQFERETAAKVNFYAPANGETDKSFRLKRGANVLFLPPFDSITSVKDEDDEEYDSHWYDIVSDVFGNYGIKIAQPFGCGASRAFWFNPLTITATWGWACVPDDVRLAVKSKGLLTFLLNPTNRKGLKLTLADETAGRLRGDYNRIVRQWAARNRTLYGGIGIG